MALVQRAHRRHQPDRALPAARGPQRGAQLADGAQRPHAGTPAAASASERARRVGERVEEAQEVAACVRRPPRADGPRSPRRRGRSGPSGRAREPAAPSSRRSPGRGEERGRGRRRPTRPGARRRPRASRGSSRRSTRPRGRRRDPRRRRERRMPGRGERPAPVAGPRRCRRSAAPRRRTRPPLPGDGHERVQARTPRGGQRRERGRAGAVADQRPPVGPPRRPRDLAVGHAEEHDVGRPAPAATAERAVDGHAGARRDVVRARPRRPPPTTAQQQGPSEADPKVVDVSMGDLGPVPDHGVPVAFWVKVRRQIRLRSGPVKVTASSWRVHRVRGSQHPLDASPS